MTSIIKLTGVFNGKITTVKGTKYEFTDKDIVKVAEELMLLADK